MTPTGIITAIVIGAIIGLLGRLVLPGKQPIGLLVTILVGIVSALIGTWLARQLGIPTATSGIDWMELLVLDSVRAGLVEWGSPIDARCNLPVFIRAHVDSSLH